MPAYRLRGAFNTIGVALAVFAVFRALPSPDETDLSCDSPQHKILPGKGLENCALGQPVKAAIDLFGEPNKRDNTYVYFDRQGIIIQVQDENITGLFFKFRSRTAVTFDGEVDGGIGMWSTIPQVLKKHGKPSRIRDSIVSEFGSIPGARDYTLVYDNAGISFTFYDNELAFISVYEPTAYADGDQPVRAP